MIGPMRPGDPVPNDFGPWCACGEWRTRSATTRLCPVCADDEAKERTRAVAAIGHSTRWAGIFKPREGNAA